MTKNIRELRRQRGLAVRELADCGEMERSDLSRPESGCPNPAPRTLCAVCAALHVETGGLLR